LNELKGKKEWKWEEEHQKAFKEKIMSQLVLSLPKREGKFRMEMDVSCNDLKLELRLQLRQRLKEG